MIYLKVKKKEFGDLIETTRNDILIEVYEDMFYSTCPLCSKDHNIEFDDLLAGLNSGMDFSGTSIYCDECSKRRMKNAKRNERYTNKNRGRNFR